MAKSSVLSLLGLVVVALLAIANVNATPLPQGAGPVQDRVEEGTKYEADLTKKTAAQPHDGKDPKQNMALNAVVKLRGVRGEPLGSRADNTSALAQALGKRGIDGTPICMNEHLNKCAMDFAAKLAAAGQMDHQFGGTTPDVRIKAAGFQNAAATAENLAANHNIGMNSLFEAINQWIKSPLHLINMQNLRYNYVGYGAARGPCPPGASAGVCTHWVQVFAQGEPGKCLDISTEQITQDLLNKLAAGVNVSQDVRDRMNNLAKSPGYDPRTMAYPRGVIFDHRTRTQCFARKGGFEPTGDFLQPNQNAGVSYKPLPVPDFVSDPDRQQNLVKVVFEYRQSPAGIEAAKQQPDYSNVIVINPNGQNVTVTFNFHPDGVNVQTRIGDTDTAKPANQQNGQDDQNGQNGQAQPTTISSQDPQQAYQTVNHAPAQSADTNGTSYQTNPTAPASTETNPTLPASNDQQKQHTPYQLGDKNSDDTVYPTERPSTDSAAQLASVEQPKPVAHQYQTALTPVTPQSQAQNTAQNPSPAAVQGPTAPAQSDSSVTVRRTRSTQSYTSVGMLQPQQDPPQQHQQQQHDVQQNVQQSVQYRHAAPLQAANPPVRSVAQPAQSVAQPAQSVAQPQTPTHYQTSVPQSVQAAPAQSAPQQAPLVQSNTPYQTSQ